MPQIEVRTLPLVLLIAERFALRKERLKQGQSCTNEYSEGEVSMVGMITNAFSFGVTLAVAVLCFMIIAGAATKKTTEVSAKSHWIHKREVPRFGGVAILLGLTYLFLANDPTLNSVSTRCYFPRSHWS